MPAPLLRTSLITVPTDIRLLAVCRKRYSAGTSPPVSGCLAPSRRGNAALRSPTSADTTEQPVLNARNQPNNHRRQRTERRFTCVTQLIRQRRSVTGGRRHCAASVGGSERNRRRYSWASSADRMSACSAPLGPAVPTTAPPPASSSGWAAMLLAPVTPGCADHRDRAPVGAGAG